MSRWWQCASKAEHDAIRHARKVDEKAVQDDAIRMYRSQTQDTRDANYIKMIEMRIHVMRTNANRHATNSRMQREQAKLAMRSGRLLEAKSLSSQSEVSQRNADAAFKHIGHLDAMIANVAERQMQRFVVSSTAEMNAILTHSAINIDKVDEIIADTHEHKDDINAIDIALADGLSSHADTDDTHIDLFAQLQQELADEDALAIGAIQAPLDGKHLRVSNVNDSVLRGAPVSSSMPVPAQDTDAAHEPHVDIRDAMADATDITVDTFTHTDAQAGSSVGDLEGDIQTFDPFG